ncbi:MAG: cupin domain-containing protein [Acidobacteriota bacterium]
MDERARRLIERLGLAPHPEGGYYREVYRSTATVRPDDDRPHRTAATTIYYMLIDGQQSRWHRVRSDEIWHFYGGDPLDLFVMPPTLDRVEPVVLEPAHPVHVVPREWWQAARPTGAYGLAGCTVAPGFEFEDFYFLGDDVAAAGIFRQRHPELASLI